MNARLIVKPAPDESCFAEGGIVAISFAFTIGTVRKVLRRDLHKTLGKFCRPFLKTGHARRCARRLIGKRFSARGLRVCRRDPYQFALFHPWFRDRSPPRGFVYCMR